MTWFLLLSLFGAVFAFCLAFTYLIIPRIHFRIRLRRMFKETGAENKNPQQEVKPTGRLYPYYQRLDRGLKAAELPITAREVLHILLWANLFIILLTVLFGPTLLILLIPLNLTPYVLIRFFQNRRRQRMVHFLPDMLVLMSNALKAGYSIVQTMDLLSKEDFGPLSREFAKLSQALRYGENFEKAFSDMANRLQMHEIDTVVDTILITRETGGNLTHVIDNLVLILEENQQLMGDIRAITAQGRISALVVGLLPVGVFLFLMLFNPEYVMVLFDSMLGISLLIISVLMQIVGFLIMKKIINIKVR